MIREQDVEVRIGRCDGGSFLQLIHRPTGISRIAAPIGNRNQHELKKQWLREIEAELRAKGLTHYLAENFDQESSADA